MAGPSDRTSESPWPVTPIDLREHELPMQAALGFHRGRTEELLSRAANTIEQLTRELAELRAAKESWEQERELLEHRLEEETTRAERLVGEAMLDAHKAGQALRAEAEAEVEELLAPAKQEATRIVEEAREQARELLATAKAEREGLAAQAEQYKLLAAELQQRSVEVLQRALAALEEDFRPATARHDRAEPFRSADSQAG